MNKSIPAALAERQELQRQQTVNKVLHALKYMGAQGMYITISDLVNITGLSRSVFSKPHVRKVIENYEQAYEEASFEARKQAEKAAKKKSKIKNYRAQINRLTEENAALKEECELLRGRLFLLMQRLQE